MLCLPSRSDQFPPPTTVIIFFVYFVDGYVITITYNCLLGKSVHDILSQVLITTHTYLHIYIHTYPHIYIHKVLPTEYYSCLFGHI